MDFEEDVENMDMAQLQNLVKQMRFKLMEEEDMTKRDIVQQLLEIDELDLSEQDLMDSSQGYNRGFRKSGWLKLYKYIRSNLDNGSHS